jgi:hypothetical protein
MAKAISTADSAARLDPAPSVAKPARKRRRIARAQVRAGIAA